MHESRILQAAGAIKTGQRTSTMASLRRARELRCAANTPLLELGRSAGPAPGLSGWAEVGVEAGCRGGRACDAGGAGEATDGEEQGTGVRVRASWGGRTARSGSVSWEARSHASATPSAV